MQFIIPPIHIGDGTAEIVIKIKNKFHHAAGAVHGSTYFKMLDDAAYFSANALVEDVFILMASLTIHPLRPTMEGKLTAKSNVQTRAGSQIIAEATLYNDEENKIAIGSGSFIKSKVNLSEEIGYK